MGYVKGGETFESWCKACGRGPERDDECELCQQCQLCARGPVVLGARRMGVRRVWDQAHGVLGR